MMLSPTSFGRAAKEKTQPAVKWAKQWKLGGDSCGMQASAQEAEAHSLGTISFKC